MLWVDDNPENNTKEVQAFQKSFDMIVVQKASTVEAKKYLNDNAALKSKNGSQFRHVPCAILTLY